MHSKGALWVMLVLAAFLVAGAVVAWNWQVIRAAPRQEDRSREPSQNESIAPDGDIEWNGDVEPIIPANELETYKQRARAGDNGRAHALANHYRELRRPAERRRWLAVAADRGDCAAMALLRTDAREAGDRAAASRWNDLLRQNSCTWAKAYGAGTGPNPAVEAMPLWDIQIIGDNASR